MRSFVACSLGVLASCAFAGPGAILVNDGRTFNLNASGDSDLGGASETSFAFPDSEFVPFSAGDSILATGAQSAIAAAQGAMNATLSPVSFILSGMVSGSAQIFDETGHNASSDGLARLQIGFTLADASVWRVLATSIISGGGDAQIVLSQGLNPGGSVVYAWSSDLSAGVDEQVALGPGDYTMTMESRHTLSIFGPELAQGAATLDASFTLVPTPGGATLGLIGLVAVARRRRPARV